MADNHTKGEGRNEIFIFAFVQK